VGLEKVRAALLACEEVMDEVVQSQRQGLWLDHRARQSGTHCEHLRHGVQKQQKMPKI
jgi:hypothetical protein